VMIAVQEAADRVGTRVACKALGLPRATYYRYRSRKTSSMVRPPASLPPTRKPSPRELSPEEQRKVLDVLHSERFVDKAPGEVYATLLDEGTFLCSERTMYRILAKHDEVRERRNQRVHPKYPVPQLHATAPNQVWSWDITKLRGPAKWVFYHLYVIIDIFSRYVVGWMVAPREYGSLAKRLIEAACEKQGIMPGQLDIHADRGTSMKSKVLADLGVTKTHSRPHVSNDNPYSESQFKTMKYRPEFPPCFGSIQDARSFCDLFFEWYNNDHRHSGIAMLTPEMVHYGEVQQVLDARANVLSAAFDAHPERFVKGRPVPQQPPAAAWINRPEVPAELGMAPH
jgi:putative transposase